MLQSIQFLLCLKFYLLLIIQIHHSKVLHLCMILKPSKKILHYPKILTSGSIALPYFSIICFCTYLIKSNMSFAVALPVLTIKPACFSETCAPPIVYPLSPASCEASGHEGQRFLIPAAIRFPIWFRIFCL